MHTSNKKQCAGPIKTQKNRKRPKLTIYGLVFGVELQLRSIGATLTYLNQQLLILLATVLGFGIGRIRRGTDSAFLGKSDRFCEDNYHFPPVFRPSSPDSQGTGYSRCVAVVRVRCQFSGIPRSRHKVLGSAEVMEYRSGGECSPRGAFCWNGLPVLGEKPRDSFN
jgi:hypothetical protein